VMVAVDELLMDARSTSPPRMQRLTGGWLDRDSSLLGVSSLVTDAVSGSIGDLPRVSKGTNIVTPNLVAKFVGPYAKWSGMSDASRLCDTW